MRKFVVTLSDGTKEIIEAKNSHDAISKARIQFGQLPNDINNKILDSVSTEIDDMLEELTSFKGSLKADGRSFNWNSVHANLGELSNKLAHMSQEINDVRGSLVKVDK